MGCILAPGWALDKPWFMTLLCRPCRHKPIDCRPCSQVQHPQPGTWWAGQNNMRLVWPLEHCWDKQREGKQEEDAGRPSPAPFWSFLLPVGPGLASSSNRTSTVLLLIDSVEMVSKMSNRWWECGWNVAIKWQDPKHKTMIFSSLFVLSPKYSWRRGSGLTEAGKQTDRNLCHCYHYSSWLYWHYNTWTS